MMKMIPSREQTYPRRLPFPGTLELMIEHSWYMEKMGSHYTSNLQHLVVATTTFVER